MKALIGLALLALAGAAHADASLDELWRDACLWEVGSNAEKVPAARQALIAKGDEALAHVIPGKLDTKDTLVTRALSVVVTGVKGSAAARLRDALEDPRANVRRNAADLLGQLGDAESAPLIAPLLDDPDTRGGALAALGALKSQAAAPAVVRVARGGAGIRERERVTACVTLGGMGGAEAERALLALLSDASVQVRYAAEAALVAMSSRDAVVPLLAPTADAHARFHAIHVLGATGDATVAPKLAALLRDPSPVLRGVAAEALASFATAKERAALKAALAKETDPFARGKLEEAVARR